MSLKSYIKSACLALAVIAAASCTRDTTFVDLPGEDGSALVKLSIYTPSSSLPKSTRAATADEGAVDRIKLLVLQESGGEYRYRYMVDGQQIVQLADAQRSTFNALLKSSDKPVKILLAANYNDAFTGNFEEDMDEATVKAMLVDSFTEDIEGQLPLYGEIELDELDPTKTNAFSLTMLRAVARVDVQNDTAQNEFSGDFRLESVHIYRARDQYKIAPDDAAMQTEGSMRVSSASVPSTAGEYASYKKVVNAAGDPGIEKIYLPESMPVADEGKRTSEATCVVVGGYYGSDTEPSYFRIDFNSGYEGHPFGQVLRNHKYIFNIVQVNGAGWETPDEAAENEATAIIATMQVWDELTSEMWFYGNDNYLGISSREIVLDYFAGSQRTETLQATVPFTIELLDDSGQPTGTTVSESQTVNAGFYTFQVVKDSAQDIWKLVITSTGENYEQEEYKGKFQVFTDWWTFTVDVIQQTYAGMLSTQFVRVLTITDLDGDLGTTDGTFTQSSGQAMRMVLESKANFSPSGVIPVGGVTVFDLKNETISTESSYDMYILEKVLATVDVVHLPGDCTPSATASKLIIDWHAAKDNRVLVIGLDNVGTNAIIEDYVNGIEQAGTWEQSSQVTSLKRAEDDWETPSRSDRFFNGPFGAVAETTMGQTKQTIGYNNGYGEYTVPILRVGTGQDVQGMMTHGINLNAGFVYCGDSGITSNRGAAMSLEAHQSGTVASDFDRLMANIWAWIVERATMLDQQ